MTVKIQVQNGDPIGRMVSFHRKQARLTRTGLADIAGVGKTVIYDIENGKASVRLNTLLKVLAALNISVRLDSPLMTRFEAGDHAQR